MSGPDVCAHMIPADEPCAECLAGYFNQIEARRTKQDQTMEALADEMALIGSTISRWLEGHPNPVGLNLYGIAHRLQNLSDALKR